MAAKTLPDQEYLRECFSYDPDTGILVWKHRPRSHFPDLPRRHWLTWNTKYAGGIAGTPGRKGYLVTKLDGEAYKVHRIIYKFMTGDEPPDVVDHEEGNKADNRWEKLRAATHGDNARNCKIRSRNTVGLKGVTYKYPSYVATIFLNGKNRNLGSYPTAEMAHAAYCAAAREHFGEFWNPG